MSHHRFKILFITLEYGKEISGGIGRVVNSLSLALETNIDLQIMLLRNFRVIKYTRIYRFHQQKWVKRILGHFRPQILINLIQKEHFDAVHLFHVSPVTAEVVKIIKQFFPELKIIYSCHSIAKYESDIRNIHPRLPRDEAFILGQINHLHLLNQSSLQYFEAAYGPMAGKISYSMIPNGIDAASFQVIDSRFKRKMNRLVYKNSKIAKGQAINGCACARELTVLCMSRWSWGKGLEYLLDAIPLVVAQYPNIRFIITGRRLISWEYRYWDYLQKIRQKMAGLKDYVIPMGWLNDRGRNLLLTLADIWVMPSLLEYFPYSILEPMIAKVPIISSRLDCVEEMLRDNEDCLFYEPTHPEQLAEQIIKLIENPDLRRQLAANAYAKAKAYQWDHISELYLRMYQRVIGS
ncbi:MAG TPA: glycosyltransferase family 4 protein [Bacillota bacterium]|nr:glycosyltransferase family 4 protein [Bacillota bacterium]